MINSPINDKLALRAAYSSAVHDGYVDNGTDDNDTRSARLKVKYDPKEDLSIILGSEYTKVGGKGQGVYSPFAAGVKLFDNEPDDPWVAELDGDLYSMDRKSYKVYTNLAWDLDIGELTFLSSFSRMTQDISSGTLNMDGDATESDSNGFQNEISDELRLASPVDSFMEWLVGLYYYKREYEQHWYNSDDTESHIIAENPSFAAFANAKYPVSDNFRATVGGRYTRDKDDTFTEEINPMSTGPTHDLKTTGHFDYKLGLEYDLSEDSMLWADYSTGYRQGMRGEPDETLDAYSAGVKSRFMDQRLQLNASGYYYIYSNYKIHEMAVYYYTDGNGDEQSLDDEGVGHGEAVLYGLDLSSNYILSERDRIDLSAAYMHTEVSDLVLHF